MQVSFEVLYLGLQNHRSKAVAKKTGAFMKGIGYVQLFLADSDMTIPFCFARNSIFERRLARGKVGERFPSKVD